MNSRFKPRLSFLALVAVLSLAGLTAQGAEPSPAVATHGQPSVAECQPGQAGCRTKLIPIEEWCKQNPDGCAALKAHKAQRFNPAQCTAGPVACNRARIEARINGRIQMACTEPGVNTGRCTELRSLLEKLKAKDRGTISPQGE